MLDVVPELNHERDSPPFARCSGKTFSQRPNPDEHHDRVTVVQHFGAHQPRKEQTEKAARTRPRPAKHVYLISLREMLSPVRQHDDSEKIERAFVPNAIKLFVQTKVRGANPRGVCGC